MSSNLYFLRPLSKMKDAFQMRQIRLVRHSSLCQNDSVKTEINVNEDLYFFEIMPSVWHLVSVVCTQHHIVLTTIQFFPHKFKHQGELFEMIFPLCLFLVPLTIEDLVQANTLIDYHDSMMERMKVLEVRDVTVFKNLNEKSIKASIFV